jgi:hypothetical protein
MSAAVPVLSFFDADKAEIGLMNHRSGLKRLAGSLLGHLLGGQLP